MFSITSLDTEYTFTIFLVALHPKIVPKTYGGIEKLVGYLSSGSTSGR